MDLLENACVPRPRGAGYGLATHSWRYGDSAGLQLAVKPAATWVRLLVRARITAAMHRA